MNLESNMFIKPVPWKLTQVDYSSQYFSVRNQHQQIEYEASLFDPDFLDEGNDNWTQG